MSSPILMSLIMMSSVWAADIALYQPSWWSTLFNGLIILFILSGLFLGFVSSVIENHKSVWLILLTLFGWLGGSIWLFCAYDARGIVMSFVGSTIYMLISSSWNSDRCPRCREHAFYSTGIQSDDGQKYQVCCNHFGFSEWKDSNDSGGGC